jgi:hypothetical protein
MYAHVRTSASASSDDYSVMQLTSMRNHDPIPECNDDTLRGAREGSRPKRCSSNRAVITNVYAAATGPSADGAELGAGRCSAHEPDTAVKRMAVNFTLDFAS